MSEVLIKTTDLHCGYGGVDIVKGINIEVRAGEVVALLGANGAGKTTTMLTLAGELAPISGEAQVLDLPRNRALYKRARKGLSFVTEERSIFPQLTTKQNLAVGRVNIDEATEIFPELVPLLNRRAGLLSGGEQQMLTLSRAISRSPKLLLADELSLGLAPKTVGRLLRAVRGAADQGVGALLIEQHVNRVLDIADRVYLLHHGVIEFEGTADEARANMDRIQATYLAAG
jgi:branched-chain amino acid transport system ATP-binding protein